MTDKRRLYSLLILALGISAALSHAQTPPCGKGFVGLTSVQASRPYAEAGHFTRASELQHERLGKVYKEAGVIKPLEGKIERISDAHLSVNLNRLSESEIAKLREKGRAELPKLYYFTSGAGLWSRGGGQVKALIPFNAKELLSPEEFELLVKSGDIANASKVEDVLKLAGRELKDGENAEQVAAKIVEERRATLTALISRARAKPEAITPVDIKLVNVALNSKKSGTYIPFDIWTSEQTHAPIQTYLREFETSYRTKTFYKDPQINFKVKEALEHYLEESRKRGETHLFGYQVGYHALDQATGKMISETAPIGEGAGMAKAYLDESGRTSELKAMGKTTWVFENIEVVTDLPVAMGAHAGSGKPVSVVLVPEKEGYKGGSPFLITKPGAQPNLELHEQSALPPEFASGNTYFNSNTIFQSLGLAPPKNIGFEVKNSGTGKIVRAKMNAGDITQEAGTAGIGGRIGVEYENFKNYGEFGQNGQKLIDTFRALWAQDVR